MKLDFTNVTGGFGAIPAGVYEAVVDSCEVKQNKAKNGNYLEFVYKIQSSDPAVDGKKVWDRTSLKPAGMWRTKQVLEALGFDTSGEVEFDPEDVVEIECQIEVTIREYDGKEFNDVKSVKAL